MEPKSEFGDVLCPILVTGRQDGLVSEIAKDAGVSESLVYRWKDGKEEPRPRHLRAIVRVLRRRGRVEEAELVLDAMLLDSGAQGVLLPDEEATDSTTAVERLSEAGEHVLRALRVATTPNRAPGQALQCRAHVWSGIRALQAARLAVGY